ncbi:hypothetical protein D917_01121, partial [Trichinella nativa]
RKLLTPDLRYSVFNTLTRHSIAIPEKNSADPLLFCFLPMFWLHNILDDLRDQQPSDRTFDGGWRSNIKEFTASSAANTYVKTLLHYVADQVNGSMESVMI